MTTLPLKLLLIEDSENDVFFLVRLLEKHGVDVIYTRIETELEFRTCLSSESWDLIITDHTLPDFNSIEAISILNELNHDTPLIVLSGTIDQTIAIESMRLGARDFIMKDDTSRLIPAIERELNEVKHRRQLHLSENFHKKNLQDIMNHSPAFIYIKDLQGIYTFINNKGEQILNLSKIDILGKSDFDLFNQKDAERIRYNDSNVLQTLASLEVEEIINLNGTPYIFSSIKYPLFNENSEVYAICGISTDVTDKKQQQEKLRRSQKMEAIGQLTGGIAHDFNNQLGIVIGYLDFLTDDLANNEKLLKWVNTANRATLRCVELTQQLLAFSRRTPNEKIVVNINTAFSEFSDMIRRSLTPQIEVEFNMSDDLWYTEIDIGEFQDVILNFVINARDAMPEGGKLTIETQNIKHTEKTNILGSNIHPGDYIQLVISDTGIGMDAQTIERIFEPFYTTKPVGKGTGLGLAMIYGFVHRFDGDINVYSRPGVGSTFRLSLPRSDENLELNIKLEKPTELPGGNESILIVDDEKELLNLADTYLRDLGYKTHLATNAKQALEILNQNSSIDLLFTDVVMPGGLDGYQLVQSAVNILPKLKLLITSGFTSNTIETHNLISLEKPLLNKPYTKTELAVHVRNTLDFD